MMRTALYFALGMSLASVADAQYLFPLQKVPVAVPTSIIFDPAAGSVLTTAPIGTHITNMVINTTPVSIYGGVLVTNGNPGPGQFGITSCGNFGVANCPIGVSGMPGAWTLSKSVSGTIPTQTTIVEVTAN